MNLLTQDFSLCLLSREILLTWLHRAERDRVSIPGCVLPRAARGLYRFLFSGASQMAWIMVVN